MCESERSDSLPFYRFCVNSYHDINVQLNGREPEWTIPTKSVGNELKCLKMH